MWTGTVWRAIASKNDSVHGVTGDTDWYFRNGSDTWSKTGIENSAISALNEAATFTTNQMLSGVLNILTGTEFEATGGFVSTNGFFDLASTFQTSQALVGGEISSININDDTEQIYFFDPTNLDLGKAISGSSIGWNYKQYSTFDFDANVKIYAHVTEESAWTQCTQAGTIPGITAGMTTAGKFLYVKVVLTALDSTAEFDPAFLSLDITIL